MVPAPKSVTPKETAPWEWATGTIKRQGAFAVLLALILGFLAYQANSIVPVVTSYVAVSGENNKRLVTIAEAQVESDKQTKVILDRLSESMVLLSSSVTSADRRVEVNTALLRQLTEQMARASDAMRDSPSKREEQTKLLQEIKAGIDRVAAAILKEPG